MGGLRIEQRGDTLVLGGELDHAGAAAALKATTTAIPQRVELGGIERCESAGVALLLEWLRQGRKRGHGIELLNPPAQLRDLVRFFDLEAILFNPPD